MFGEVSPENETCEECRDKCFQDVQKVVQSGKGSAALTIEIARRHNQPAVCEELLLRTDVNEEDKLVCWHRLRLQVHVLEMNWLRRIPWVKKLGLARNGFQSLPADMGQHLTEVGDTKIL